MGYHHEVRLAESSLESAWRFGEKPLKGGLYGEIEEIV
jgi:hypothetical protein